MNAYYKGMPVFGPRGPAGPDGNPIGTVISFLGSDVPKDYLVCDGTQYSISLYPALASFFEAQFGTKNHFGGNGTATFAVPDMRNLFLRGYHGEAQEQLSGEIGVKQEATESPAIFPGVNTKGMAMSSIQLEKNTAHIKIPKNPDTAHIPQITYWSGSEAPAPGRYENTGDMTSYTARPVNMAVLYCIKAVESTGGGESAGETYSTEETRIGTWIDGKPLYRKAVSVVSPGSDGASKVGDLSSDVSVVRINGYLYQDDESCLPLPFFDGTNRAWLYAEAHSLYAGVASSYFRSKTVVAIIEYTKTTD